MKLHSFDKVKQLTEDMVAIPSINKEPGGESAVARYMQDFYMSLPYFQAHPEQVKCFQTKNDFVVRHSTLAYVKGTKGNSNRTVILIGHIDTVGVDDFGTIREYAFRCEELPAKLRETFVLPQEVIDDIESGEYLFGRGALDMKSGVAGHMYLIQYFSEHPEELDGNLLAHRRVRRGGQLQGHHHGSGPAGGAEGKRTLRVCGVHQRRLLHQLRPRR